MTPGCRATGLAGAAATVLGSLLLGPLTASAELPAQSVMERVSRSVVKVHARGCQRGEAFSGTGFVWSRSDQALTALHVVAGCQQVTIRSEAVGIVRPVRILRTLERADLALLSIQGDSGLPPLQAASAPPALHDDMVAMGYELDAPGMGSVNLKASYGSSRLSDMLPPSVLREVNRAGMPSLSLHVLRHQGHLVPGLSGAPIIDQRGGVVAVADGGLENGAVAISWAIPISNVRELMASTERTTAKAAEARSLFAAELGSRSGNLIRCGTMEFQRLRSRTYRELASSSDDPQGLATFLQLANLAEIDVDDLRFDVYSHLPSGATLVVPEEIRPQPAGRGCRALAFDGNLRIHIRGSWPTDLRAAAQSFLDDTMEPTGLGWSPEPAFSYAKPTMRFDGLEVERASYNGIRRDDPGLALGMPTPVAHAFETILGRRDAFLGFVIFNADPRTFTPGSVLQCQLAASAPGCPQVRAEIRLWIAMLISAFMSTFPIG